MRYSQPRGKSALPCPALSTCARQCAICVNSGGLASRLGTAADRASQLRGNVCMHLRGYACIRGDMGSYFPPICGSGFQSI